MKHSAALLLATAIAPLFAAVANAQTTCNVTNPCGADHQCCSDFGFCDDLYCRGGCAPYKSFTPQSCKPLPVCENKVYTFPDLTRIVNSTKFDGNTSMYDWTIDNPKLELAQHIAVSNGELGLFLTEDNSGSRISTTRYMWYGRATATMKVSKWAGVITSFITMSDVHDEIDWEWPGESGGNEGQSNFFWEGVVIPQGGKHNMTSDGFSNYHDYTIDWNPDRLNWEIDGKVVRTLRRQDTLDKSSGIYKYPSTPSRVQFSIWPAGIASSAPGTVEWAGGMIDWNNADYKAAGHFYAMIKKVEVACYTDANIAPAVGDVSYVYGANVSGVPAIAFSNQTSMDAAPGLYLTGLRGLAPLGAALALALGAVLF